MVGRRIVSVSAAVVAISALVGLADLVLPALGGVATAVSLTWFLVSLPVWVVASLLVLARSTRGDDIAVASWVFLAAGAAPPAVRRRLLGAFAVSVGVAAVTCWADPFAVLVPMLPLGLAALWGARYGEFPVQRGVGVRGSRP